MTVGTIAYAVHSGLGHLAKSFFDHGVVQRIYVIPHPRYQAYPNWYPDQVRFGKQRPIKEFLKGLDALLLFQDAWHTWPIVKAAKARGIRIGLIPMYEWTPYPLPVKPDVIICPSLLDVEYYKAYNHVMLPIPVEKPWRLREKALEFVHNAGHGQLDFAKGTPQVIEAMEFVQAPIKLRVTGQPGEARIKELFDRHKSNPRVDLTHSDLADDALFAGGDVFINAERYNGLSLPLQEAHASGMLVMTTDRFPANAWLPKEPLIPVASVARHRVNHTTFDQCTIEPLAIAAKIDEWYGRDITTYSLRGKEWAAQTSWEVLKPKYMEALRR